jgi:hypothetical protein
MDSATLTYLVNTRIKQIKIKDKEPAIYDPVYKQRILDLTMTLFDSKVDGTLQNSFNHYISDCIDHLKENEKKESFNKIDIVPMKWDELMFVPKKINMIVPKKNKNIFLKHDRT